MDRDTLWFRRPPPRRSRVTDMNREEKVSPTYHHRRSTGAPILSAGASARSPVGSARAGSTAARVWVVDRPRDSVWHRCSPGSREADVSRPAGKEKLRRKSENSSLRHVRRTGCAMCGIVLRAREGNDGSVAELVQGPQSCPRWGAPLAARVAVGARVASEMRRARCGYQQTKPWAWMGAAKPRRSG